MSTLARWVETPENRPALLAVRQVADCVYSRRRKREINPLVLHGPAGTGKTHLISALVAEATRRRPDLTATVLSAGDLALLLREEEGKPSPAARDARQTDLLVIEDLQHLSAPAVEPLVQVLDARLARQRQTIITAARGPAQLARITARLASRLASGLVVGLSPLSPASRKDFLRQRAGEKGLKVPDEALAWVAENVAGSVRQLEGALSRLETLDRVNGKAPQADTVIAAFKEDADARKPTVERIAQRVGRYFRLNPKQLQARDRSRNVLLPRQVGMYLARELTGMSLQQIGAYFGGRDHSTVLHACRKVKQALGRDPSLSGVIRQLQADLA